MIRSIAISAPAVIAGIAGGLIAFAPISAAAPTSLADGPVSTTSSQQDTPISAFTGAPVGDAGLGTDPLVPYGTDPQVPVTPGYINNNHDEGVTTNEQVDLAI